MTKVNVAWTFTQYMTQDIPVIQNKIQSILNGYQMESLNHILSHKKTLERSLKR